MGKISTCPYCSKEMYLGVIYQDRYAIKWILEENDKGAALQLLSKGIKLTNLLDTGSVDSYYCKEYEKIIIDTKDKINQNS